MYSTTMSMIDTVKHNMPCQPQIFLTDRRHINDSGRVRSLHRCRPGPCPALRRGPPSLLSPFSLGLSLSVFPSRRTMDRHEPAPPSASARARKPRGDQRARHIPTLARSLASHTSESSKSRGREGGGRAARRRPAPGSDERSAKISS